MRFSRESWTRRRVTRWRLQESAVVHRPAQTTGKAIRLSEIGHTRHATATSSRCHSYPCPETHRRAQPLQFEAPNARNARKSAITGMPTAAFDPIDGVARLAPFPMPKPTPSLCQGCSPSRAGSPSAAECPKGFRGSTNRRSPRPLLSEDARFAPLANPG
jgi:hypothetical protein